MINNFLIYRTPLNFNWGDSLLKLMFTSKLFYESNAAAATAVTPGCNSHERESLEIT